MTRTAPTGIPLPSSSAAGESVVALVEGSGGVGNGTRDLPGLGRRSGVANPMIALKRCVKRLVPDGAGPDALEEEEATLSCLRKRDMMLGAAVGGTFGVHSDARFSPSVSCIVEMERNRSESSSSVAGDAGVIGDGALSSSGTASEAREARCDCAV